MDFLLQSSLPLIIAIQSLPGLEGLMEFFSFLGREEFFLLIIPFVYWCVSPEFGTRLVLLLLASNSLNTLLKLGFHWPRPYWVDPQVHAFSAEPTYGFPSGHAQNAVTMWGGIAHTLRRGWAWGVGLMLMLLISFSRLYLGVHFPIDLLGGWLAGAAVLVIYVRWEQPLTARLRSLTLWAQFGVVSGVTLLYLVVGGLILSALAATPDPELWARTAVLTSPTAEIAPRNPENLVTNAGLIFGAGLALALIAHQPQARFNAGGDWRKRGARFIIGVIGLLLVWRGLAVVFPTEPVWLALSLRFVRYALAVGWMFYLGPGVFLKLRLAEPV